MHLVLYAAPTSDPVTRAEAKAHLNIATSFTDDDSLIDALVSAATRRAEAYTGRAFFTQTWDLYFDFRFPARIDLPRPPLASVSAITYTDEAGATQTLAADQYQVSTSGPVGRIVPAYGVTWPTTRGMLDDVKVRFVAGVAVAAIPADVKHAIKLDVGALYEHRESFVTGTIATELPIAATHLLAPHRCTTVLVAA